MKKSLMVQINIALKTSLPHILPTYNRLYTHRDSALRCALFRMMGWTLARFINGLSMSRAKDVTKDILNEIEEDPRWKLQRLGSTRQRACLR